MTNLRDSFELGDEHVFLQTLVGGAIELREKTQAALERESASVAAIAFDYLRRSGRAAGAAIVSPTPPTAGVPASAPPPVAPSAPPPVAPVAPLRAVEIPAVPPAEAEAAPVTAPLAQASTDDVEAQVHQLWQEILGRTDFGVSDNFFEAGGNSLLAVQLANGFRARWGLELNVVSIFEQPTIATQAGLVTKLAPAPASVELVADSEPKPSGNGLRERMLAARQVSRAV